MQPTFLDSFPLQQVRPSELAEGTESFPSMPRGRGWGLPHRPFCGAAGSGVGEMCVPVCVSVVGLL